MSLKQFAICNSQFTITFCDGDLDPDTFTRCLIEALDLNPYHLLKQ
ncbi:hypothetical protein GXM_04735 [Nostoc sphaeroides CCNUC1]|uniref:Uncharacterized protein n=1 Tax=Nostoc sphaeroides CCNUC1 TaxID=2653204 RepID=A0A5P8W3C6_9NOSO|nr:hypothetical protein GXM_04735 [Nostoc sphaeroides CCNUC1]